ncbi:hypothetical protein FJV80_16150 [Mesorhizobium sp. WSM4310]|uniref:hypothetical protein n=1 Tax=Mesorhizobium sp. WSM4310 TaxID=2589883 RepID=UPI00115EAE84|nr:hypothetical protein [Mesorhizobium sp. WSM4310]TRC85836.1 hypothetical protein FJV80_16150 [Mesorhizobium sp. WSM4310]
MVDLGFLDKFEEYFGRRAAKALVGLAAAGAVIVMLGGAWSYVSPLVAWANTDGLSWSQFAFRVVTFLISFGAVISLGSLAAQAMEARARQRQFIADVDKITDQLHAFVSEIEKAAAIQDETLAIFEESVEILDHLKDRQAAESLRKTIKKSQSTRDSMRRLSERAGTMATDLVSGLHGNVAQADQKALPDKDIVADSKPDIA